MQHLNTKGTDIGTSVSKSTRYYKASNKKKRGAKPSEFTTLSDGSSVSNLCIGSFFERPPISNTIVFL
jgi:hypothetical protein